MAKNHSDYALHVRDEDGEPLCVLPGDEIPDHVQVINPYVLGDKEDKSATPANTGGPPPKSGKGSGVRAWRAYAAENGVDADGLDVAEIIAELEGAGVPVE